MPANPQPQASPPTIPAQPAPVPRCPLAGPGSLEGEAAPCLTLAAAQMDGDTLSLSAIDSESITLLEGPLHPADFITALQEPPCVACRLHLLALVDVGPLAGVTVHQSAQGFLTLQAFGTVDGFQEASQEAKDAEVPEA